MTMTMTITGALAIASFFAFASAAAFKDPNYVGNRTTMVHLFEWKFSDIADECERFLGPKGYGGVQVSPIQENVIIESRPWYERYQPISYKWRTRSGDEKGFKSMVRRCNDVGVRIYVDVLLNHMSGDHEDALGTGDSRASPYRMHYPDVPYQSKHFHSVCEINNYRDPVNIRNCELVGLHDLDQSQEYVRDKIAEMMNEMIDAGVAGFRIDAAKHMWPEDLKAIYLRLNDLNAEHGFPHGSKPFIFQEVIDYNGKEAVKKTEYNDIGTVTEFKFGHEISNALLKRNPLKWFRNWGVDWDLLPSEDALVFIDNHDTQRSRTDNPLTYKNSKLYKIAVAFMLGHSFGIPRVMSSFDFHKFDQGPPADGEGRIVSPVIKHDETCANGWVCEHRWREIYNMAGFRNYVGRSQVTEWWDNDGYQIAFCRGDRGFVAVNADSYDLKRRLRVCLPAGTYCDVISGGVAAGGGCTGRSILVDEDGTAEIEIRSDGCNGVLAIHGGVKVA